MGRGNREGMGFSQKDINRAQATAAKKVTEDHAKRDKYYEEKRLQKKFNARATYSDHDKGALTRAKSCKR